MSKLVIGLAAVSALAFGGSALAQTAPPPPASTMPPAAATTPPPAAAPMAPGPATPAPAAPEAAAPAPAAPAAPLAAGMQLKDNTGVVVGQIADLKPDASGSQLATIKMGADTFTVAAAALVVQNGAAVINMTQAQLQAQVHPKG